MLKWYAETFKLSERQLTSVALKRIKWLTILSLPAVPLAIVDAFVEVPSQFTVPFFAMFAISFISFFSLLLTKFVNRFWARDRYLDEWEKARKHQAMAFAFQILNYSFVTILVLGVLRDAFPIVKNVNIASLDGYDIGVLGAGLMIFGFYVMHIYLLFTVKPIDEIEKGKIIKVT